MTDRTLPEATQIVIAQQEWDDRNKRFKEVKEKQRRLEFYKSAGLSEAQYASAHEAWCDYDELLEQLHDEMTELENWLIDHSAPGWVAT